MSLIFFGIWLTPWYIAFFVIFIYQIMKAACSVLNPKGCMHLGDLHLGNYYIAISLTIIKY